MIGQFFDNRNVKNIEYRISTSGNIYFETTTSEEKNFDFFYFYGDSSGEGKTATLTYFQIR